MKEVASISRKTLQQPMFDLGFEEPMTFEQFRNTQETHTFKFINNCRMGWLKDIVLMIQKLLKDDTSGCFNLDSVNLDRYEDGKLKALLKTVDLKVADYLYLIVKRNFSCFA